MRLAQPDFREDLYRAREIRADFSFGEQVIDIADDASRDWYKAANGRTVMNKEVVLRSKLRIEARRFHMERLHRDTWGERIKADVKHDFTHLSEEERVRKVHELLGLMNKKESQARQSQMARRHPEEWGDRRQIDVKNGWNLLSAD